MSKIYVDEIAGIASPSTVAIPGHVIQVVTAELNSQINVATSSETNLFSASITPSSATSKILVMSSIQAYVGGSTSSEWFYISLRRDGASGLLLQQKIFYRDSGYFKASPNNHTFVDSPNTTSSQTYAITAARDSGSDTLNFNSGSNYGPSTLTLMEIAG